MKENKSFWRIVAPWVAAVLVLWFATPFVVMQVYPKLEESAHLGDIYGVLNALFSGFAFAGIIAAIHLQRQELRLQRRELRLQRREHRRTAGAQERQVKDTSILQRAYLTVEPSGVHLMIHSHLSVAHVEIINSGNLPAYDVAWGIAFAFDPDHDRKEFEPPPVSGRVILPPKGRMTQGSGGITFPSDIVTRNRWPEGASSNPTHLYVWGRVVYTDGFEHSRVTEFCHRYNCMAATADQIGDKDRFEIDGDVARQHRHGNRAE